MRTFLSALFMSLLMGGRVQVKRYLRRTILSIILGLAMVVLFAGALVALSCAAYSGLVHLVPASIAWLLIGLVYALGGTTLLVAMLVLMRFK